jgi:hypothetical protein
VANPQVRAVDRTRAAERLLDIARVDGVLHGWIR